MVIFRIFADTVCLHFSIFHYVLAYLIRIKKLFHYQLIILFYNIRLDTKNEGNKEQKLKYYTNFIFEKN